MYIALRQIGFKPIVVGIHWERNLPSARATLSGVLAFKKEWVCVLGRGRTNQDTTERGADADFAESCAGGGEWSVAGGGRVCAGDGLAAGARAAGGGAVAWSCGGKHGPGGEAGG